ncbi:MAG: hypothetical protein M1828_007059 [Chrysothrix sp. TS-e1954]|nr:MAG: hypothetical protein M1828_007059 [Chrysothrix sp. TS-e1954]
MALNDTVIRPVGMLEKLSTARQVLGVYNSVILTISYTDNPARSTEELKRRIVSSLPRLLIQHPALCCYITGAATSSPTFRLLDTIAVEDVVQMKRLECDLPTRLQELHDQPWSEARKPLWRLAVLQDDDTPSTHLAFVYHHAIGDGLSGAAFQRSLIQALARGTGTQDSGASPNVIEVPSVSLSKPVEDLLSFSLSWGFLAKQVLQEYAPRWLVGAPPEIWAGKRIQTLDECPSRTRLRIVDLQADELLVRCREHGVTLTSLITATIACSLSDALPNAPAFIGMTPYTLRRFTGTSMDEMVNQTSTSTMRYPRETIDGRSANERLWSVATKFQDHMRDELAQCPSNNPVGLLPYVIDTIEYYRKKFGKPREATWELSNIGAFNHDGSAEWTPEYMTFTQGAAPTGSAFGVNCVSIDGLLSMTISHQESVIDKAIVDAVAYSLSDLHIVAAL